MGHDVLAQTATNRLAGVLAIGEGLATPAIEKLGNRHRSDLAHADSGACGGGRLFKRDRDRQRGLAKLFGGPPDIGQTAVRPCSELLVALTAGGAQPH